MVGSEPSSAPPLPQFPFTHIACPQCQLTNCPWLLLTRPQAAGVLVACKQGVLLLQLVVCREGEADSEREVTHPAFQFVLLTHEARGPF